LIDAFNIGVTADFYILNSMCILDNTTVTYLAVVSVFLRIAPIGHLMKAFLSNVVLTVSGPQEDIARLHTIEGPYRASTIFIAELQLYPSFFHISGFQNAVSKFCIMARLHLVDVGQHHLIAYNEVRHITDMMDGYRIAKVAADNRRMVDACRQPQIAVI